MSYDETASDDHASIARRRAAQRRREEAEPKRPRTAAEAAAIPARLVDVEGGEA